MRAFWTVAITGLLFVAACGQKTGDAPAPEQAAAAPATAAPATAPKPAEEPPPLPESARVPAETPPTPRGAADVASREGNVRIRLPTNLRLTPGLRSPPGTPASGTDRPKLPTNLRLPGLRNPASLDTLVRGATAATGAIDCDGDEVIVREGTTIDAGAAPAVQARGRCKVTLNDCTLTSATFAIMADGESMVVVKGGKLTGGQAAIAARGRARVATMGATVEGATDQKDDAVVVTR